MAFEIIETTDLVDVSDSTPRSQFTVIDPHSTHPIVDSIHDNRDDAEEALAEIKRDEAITESFDAWIHATADEHGVNRQTVANTIDVTQFR
tara:strand:+ start:184 stop:456 length:273 start_codon:yes stop_codon:yes gene_type:complete